MEKRKKRWTIRKHMKRERAIINDPKISDSFCAVNQSREHSERSTFACQEQKGIQTGTSR